MRNVSDLGWKTQSVLLVSFKYILFSVFSAMCSPQFRRVLFATSPGFHTLTHMKIVTNIMTLTSLHYMNFRFLKCVAGPRDLH